MAVLGPFDFRGGYSPGYDFTTMPPDQGYALTMENCRFRNGMVVLRYGQNVVNSAQLGGSASTGITIWQDTVNSKKALVVVVSSNAKLYIADISTYLPGNAAITFTDRSGAITFSTSINPAYTFDSLNNILIGAGNSVTPIAPFKITAWNANAAALGGSPPNADCVKQVNNFLFLSRNLSSTTTQSTVYWSNVNDPETWTGTNVLNFNKNDGEPIMALGSIGTDLYIFKQTSIGRLSTVTLTVSGAVTLGPLVTVIKGVGCCGPRALDNLPNGNIVFVGTDGHFYEFDGSSLSDLSRTGYPGHNVYNNGTYLNSGSIYRNSGLSTFSVDTNVGVKVWKGINEVWIYFGKTNNGDTGNSFMYDFENRIWQGNGGFGTVSIYGSPLMVADDTPNFAGQSSISIESTSVLYSAISGGDVVVSGNPKTPYPTDANTGGGVTPRNFSIGTTIQFSKEGFDFIPRTVIFETSQTQASNSNLSSLSLYADFDVYTTQTLTTAKRIYNSSGLLPNRIIATLPMVLDTKASVTVTPTFLNLLWVGVGTGTAASSAFPEIFRLGKFYISDEILR